MEKTPPSKPIPTILASALVPFFKKLTAPHLIVLNYHAISRTRFLEHVRFLGGHFEFASQDTFDRVFGGLQRPRRHSLLLTFDDGYRSLFHDIYPDLNRLGIPALVFPPARLISDLDIIWPDYVKLALLETPSEAIRIHNCTVALKGPKQRQRLFRNLLRHLLKLPNQQRMEILEQLKQQLSRQIALEPYLLLTWEHIRTMAAGGVDFGSHGHTHAVLSRLPARELAGELRESKRLLEAETAKPVFSLAYPNGKAADYSQSVIRAARSEGFRYAFTTIQGSLRPGANPFELKRIMLFEKQGPLEIAIKILLLGARR